MLAIGRRPQSLPHGCLMGLLERPHSMAADILQEQAMKTARHSLQCL